MLGLGLNNVKGGLARTFVTKFLSRVKSDGATVEGKVCLKLQTNVLKEKEETI